MKADRRAGSPLVAGCACHRSEGLLANFGLQRTSTSLRSALAAEAVIRWAGDMVDGMWLPNEPPAAEGLAALRAAAPAALPLAYFAQLESSNGGEVSLSVGPGWVSFWPAEAVLSCNDDYGVSLSARRYSFAVFRPMRGSHRRIRDSETTGRHT